VRRGECWGLLAASGLGRLLLLLLLLGRRLGRLRRLRALLRLGVGLVVHGEQAVVEAGHHVRCLLLLQLGAAAAGVPLPPAVRARALPLLAAAGEVPVLQRLQIAQMTDARRRMASKRRTRDSATGAPAGGAMAHLQLELRLGDAALALYDADGLDDQLAEGPHLLALVLPVHAAQVVAHILDVGVVVVQPVLLDAGHNLPVHHARPAALHAQLGKRTIGAAVADIGHAGGCWRA
jgi:hypothetical protein